jgi:hypothetical protein
LDLFGNGVQLDVGHVALGLPVSFIAAAVVFGLAFGPHIELRPTAPSSRRSKSSRVGQGRSSVDS